MAAVDRERNVVCWSEAAADVLGLSAREMMGRPLSEAVPEHRRRLLERLLTRVLERGAASEFEVRLPDKHGKPRDLVVVLSAVPDADGLPVGAAAWVLDETQRKLLADKLAQAEKIASLGTLAGGVAHHFNNILGGVATFVDYALTSGDIAAMKRALQMTSEAASRAGKITQSLLSFAEQDQRRADLADLTEVVLTFSHLVERPLAEKKIHLDLDLRPAPICAVEANRMHQVLGNLLTNAEEAMPSSGMVRICIAPAESSVVLTFADTGIGIPADQLPLVFEPFFTTKGLLAGGDQANPGLGLSVVHGIIVEMGGTIDVQSNVGEGTVFTIVFPVAERKRIG